MSNDILDIIKSADVRDWKSIGVDFGEQLLDIRVPERCELLTMQTAACLADPREAVRKALGQPIGSPTIS